MFLTCPTSSLSIVTQVHEVREDRLMTFRESAEMSGTVAVDILHAEDGGRQILYWSPRLQGCGEGSGGGKRRSRFMDSRSRGQLDRTPMIYEEGKGEVSDVGAGPG